MKEKIIPTYCNIRNGETIEELKERLEDALIENLRWQKDFDFDDVLPMNLKFIQIFIDNGIACASYDFHLMKDDGSES